MSAIGAEQVIDGTTHAVLVSIGGTTTTLTPTQAESLSNDLWNAAVHPDDCTFCDLLAATVIQGSPVCQPHATAWAAREQLAP